MPKYRPVPKTGLLLRLQLSDSMLSPPKVKTSNNKKPRCRTRTTTEPAQKPTAVVQALASQGNEVALFHALVSTQTVGLLIVSPQLRGSNPYPCGSLTYRTTDLLYSFLLLKARLFFGVWQISITIKPGFTKAPTTIPATSRRRRLYAWTAGALRTQRDGGCVLTGEAAFCWRNRQEHRGTEVVC